MKELNDIVVAYDKAILQQKKTALVTVVQVIGSSYRRPGARMLVTEDGEITGAISGGCLEGDALRKAQFAIQQQQNRLEIYDTTDDDHQLGVQLGCNGIVYILFEPIRHEAADNPIQLLKEVATHQTTGVLVTFFNPQKNAPQKGTCHFYHGNETSQPYPNNWQEVVPAVLQEKRSVVHHISGQSALFQFVPPLLQLVIVGAGNDTQPLMDLAHILGWRIIVVDGRPKYATRARFPKAHQVTVTRAEDILSAIPVTDQTAVVLMTHNYNYDLAVLELLISANCPYIGLLGPQKKRNKMLEELAGKGVSIPESILPNIYGPVGLDIGAETSEEIALSIVAEIKAVFSNRQGTPLKNRLADIHERPYLAPHD